ncbi:MAG: hypothetical protein IPJ65_07250 [Archangiaceae bacterium]|nr:hypothetical protein [Archangiaceae bacterium]
MAFVDILKQDPISWVVLVDVSFDDFSSVAYRWSTLSCSIGGNDYEGRIPKGGVGKLSRAFGNENTPTSSTVTVSLDNTDFGADWLLDRTTVASQVMRARFKLTLAIYLPGNLSSVQTKVLGTFSMLNFPMRDRERVTLQLADDGLGRFNEPLVSPTLREWRDDAGSTVDNCPIVEEYGPEPACDWDVPLPLAFGQGRLTCFPASNLNAIDGLGEVIDGLMAYSRAIPVCVTTSSAAVVPADARGHVGDVRALWGTFGQDVLMGNKKYDGAGTTISIPPTFRTPADTPVDVGVMANVDLVIWEVMKSQAISKDGTSWYILWVKFNIAAYITWFKITRRTQVGGEQVDGGTSPIAFLVPYTPVGGAGGLNPTPPPAWAALETLSVGDKRKYNGGIYEVITAGTTGSVGPGFSTSQDITDGTVHWRYATSAVLGVSIPYGQIFAAFSHFEVLGHPFSARTVTDQDDQLGVNVIKDLVSYYSHGSAADLDTTRFATALSMSPMSVAGVIQPQRPLSTRFKYSASRPPADAISRGQLWQALSDICQSADLDISLTWEGKLAVYGSYFSYADLTSTRVQIDETRSNNVVERIRLKASAGRPTTGSTWCRPTARRTAPSTTPIPTSTGADRSTGCSRGSGPSPSRRRARCTGATSGSATAASSRSSARSFAS